jgi:CRP/FNR family transcriptional regulator, anaerobic regulatory protein
MTGPSKFRACRQAASLTCALQGCTRTRARSLKVECIHLGRRTALNAASDPAEALFTVCRGVVQISFTASSGCEPVSSVYYRGHLLDPYARNGGGTNVTVRAVTASTVCRIDWRNASLAPEAMLEIMRARHDQLARQFFAGEAWRTHLLSLAPIGRLAWLLLTLAARAEHHTAVPDEIALHMRRSDLADHLGVTTETLCRLLARLEAQDAVVRTARSHLRILDRAALQRIAACVTID